MQIAAHSFTIFEIAIVVLILASVSANIAIFNALKKSYSIKYELLRSKFFRKSKCLMMTVRVFFWINNLLPSILLVALFVEILVRGYMAQAFVVLVNGLLLLAMSMFSSVRLYYYKLLAVFMGAVASQLVIIFLLKFSPENFYVCISCVFFSLNGVLVGLTVWSVENIYWDFSEIVTLMPDKVETVNK